MTKRKVIIHTAAEAMKPQPPIKWIVEGLFSQGSVSLIVGEGGSKKTYFMLDCGVCVALGEPWIGMQTTKSKVLIIDEESGNRRIKRRLYELINGHNTNGRLPLKYTTLHQFNLRHQSELKSLNETIIETKAKLVVIDALADVMIGGDENSVRDVQPIFQGLRSIAEKRQAAIVLIHHAGKAGGYRGSTAMHGAVDLMMRVESKSTSPSVDVESVKTRDVDPFTFAAQIHFEDEKVWFTEALFTKDEKLNKGERYVMRYLNQHGKSWLADIKVNADTCSPITAGKGVYSLAERGLIERVDSGGRGSKAMYDIVRNDAAQEILEQLKST